MRSGLLFSLVLLSRTSAAPWTRTFGNCIFKGDTDGAPLVRAGSCPTQTGTLDLSVKGITLLPANVFEGMANMTRVELAYNRLTALPADVFSGLSLLSYLYLHENQLTALPADVFSGLRSLSNLHLANNRLTSLPSGIFTGLSALSNLHLADNRLTSLPSGIFTGLSALRRVELYNNLLNSSSLPADVFYGLSALRILRLDGNQLDCAPLSAQQLAALTYYGPSALCAPTPTTSSSSTSTPPPPSTTTLTPPGRKKTFCTQVACFTGTKVQMLTQKAPPDAVHVKCASSYTVEELLTRYQRCGKDRCGGPACTATEPVFATGGTGNNMPPEAEFEVWVVVCDKLAKECYKFTPSRHDLSVCL